MLSPGEFLRLANLFDLRFRFEYTQGTSSLKGIPAVEAARLADLLEKLGTGGMDNLNEWLTEELQIRGVTRDEYREILSRLDVLEKRTEDLKEEVKTLRVEMNQRFEGIDVRLDRMNERFDRMNERFDRMNERMISMISMMKWTIGTIGTVGALLAALITIFKVVG